MVGKAAERLHIGRWRVACKRVGSSSCCYCRAGVSMGRMWIVIEGSPVRRTIRGPFSAVCFAMQVEPIMTKEWQRGWWADRGVIDGDMHDDDSVEGSGVASGLRWRAGPL